MTIEKAWKEYLKSYAEQINLILKFPDCGLCKDNTIGELLAYLEGVY